VQELESLLLTLERRALLFPEFFDFDHDNALDERDADPFDSRWMKVHRELKDIPISTEQKELLTQIRREAFLATMEATKNSDLAGYVSDDFDLLCRGIIAGSTDPWLNGVWVAYCTDEFPSGAVKDRSGNLRSLFSDTLFEE
jgi:hypothetical protein